MKNKPKRTTLSPELLQRLYGAAHTFREIECWNWMWDSDLFGVQNPADGEISYCCVMGRNGQHFAIAAYTGTEGLRGYFRFLNEETAPDQYENYFSQTCLSVTFEDKDMLDAQDRQALRRAGYQANGPHAWPEIRSHSPGFEPWYVNADEAAFLIHILEQATQVALRLKQNPDALESPGGEECLVRIPEQGPTGLKWSDKWVQPTITDEPVDSTEPLDEVRVARIKKTIPRSPNVWEIGCFYAPGRVVGEGPRPYLPRMTMCVDHDSTLVLCLHSSIPSHHRKEFPEHIMGFIEKTGIIPHTILAGKQETLRMLAPVASALGIEAELSDDMAGLTQAVTSMFEYFERPGTPGADGLPPGGGPKGGLRRRTRRRR